MASSSPEPSSRRRSRSIFEDDEDSDRFRASSRQSPGPTNTKRARRSGNDSDSNFGFQEPVYPQYDDEEEDETGGERQLGAGGFQPGSIRRVKVTNFVTYEKAEFFPGPNLNMVIGPNGTGKSSLVCAICLGLGLGPKHLGRAGEVGEFVKHGMTEAEIEIELEKRKQDRYNYVVRVRIIRDGNQREWYMDGKKTTLKAVQQLTKSLSIQIDNLCQFLPQDKVSEFAALSPVDLLLQTQRAAAPEEMLEQHEQLKIKRKEQKAIEQKHAADKEILENMETRQQNLQEEVQRLQERQQIQHNITILKKKIPFIEYRIARLQHLEFKKKKAEAQNRLAKLRARVAPLLASVISKQSQRDQIAVVVKEREHAVRTVQQKADTLVERIGSIDEEIEQKELLYRTKVKNDNDRKTTLRKIQQKITNLESELKAEPIPFDASAWNERIARVTQEWREIGNQGREARAIYDRHMEIGAAKRKDQQDIQRELRQFESAEGQQISALETFSKDTAMAWKWIKENRDKFEKEVYGPPIVSCSIKDPRYMDQIESLFQRTDFLAFTCQTPADFNQLTRGLFDELKLGDITVKSIPANSLDAHQRSRLSSDVLREFGFEHWALDLIEGPAPVLTMLCQSIKLHIAGLTLRDMSEDQFNKVVESNKVNGWVTGRHNYRIFRRVEYGPSATSVTSKPIGPARYWTNRPVDSTKREEFRSRIEALDIFMEEYQRTKVEPAKKEMDRLKASFDQKKAEETKLKTDKSVQQKLWAAQQAVPDKIRLEREHEAENKKQAVEIRQALNKLNNEHDDLTLQKAKLALELHALMPKLRACHQDVLEAKIRLIETASDIASLNERNSDITDQVAREEQLVQHVEVEARRVKDIAARTRDVCIEIQADPEMEPYIDQFKVEEPGITVALVEREIASEESRLDFIHATNPNAIRDFEARQKEVERLQEKMEQNESRLRRLEAQITKIRDVWEPALDGLIEKISEAFSFNFEQIGCAGEVSIHKDEDFELWAIQIKVRFRENETLQILDAHRQSGGERSVSTIFYLMSLQSMARAPFRVVDEINQGMDPRNERMVHERMVEIACKEHTSQYFLITPKLLTGLRYDRRMKVLCIASGEHMPDNYKKLDVSRVIGIQRAIVAAG